MPRVSMTRVLDDAARAALDTEARRLYRRYQLEFVEAFNLCPWAARAREDGQVAVRVILERGPDALERAVEHAGAIALDDTLAVGLLLFPRSTHDRLAHEAFASQVRARVAEEAGSDSQVLAMAAFHPHAEADLRSAGRLVPFIRRSPDPTIQLVRLSALESVRRATADRGTAFLDPAAMDLSSMMQRPARPPLHERVAERNLETVREQSLTTMESILVDILDDRTKSYARLLSADH